MKQLDLHHTRHNLVQPKLIRFIEDNWNQDIDAEIITGNSDEMKKLVKDILDEYKLYYREGSFDGVNKGFLRVWI